MAGWVTLICGFALWPVVLIWAYVDIPRRAAGVTAMMIAIMAVYLVLLFALVRFGIVRFNLFWKIVALHRSAAAQPPAVHSDGVERAAGVGTGGAQRGVDRAQCGGRGHRGAGCGQYGTEGG